MQSFLPYADFEHSAAVLDYKRCGKMITEGYQIMTALLENRGWVNHTATRMWRGHELWLLLYIEACNDVWTNDWGYKPNVAFDKALLLYSESPPRRQLGEPPWLGDPDLHLSHQSMLAQKDPQFYGPRFPRVRTDLTYYWPGREERLGPDWK